MSRNVYAIRIVAVFFAAAFVFAWLGIHFFTVQVVRHEELYDKARAIYTAQRTHQGTRGRILDRHGNLLVGNVNCQDIRCEVRRVPAEQRLEMIRTLSIHLGVPVGTLQRRFDSGSVEIVVANGVDQQTAHALRDLKLPGLRFVDSQRRYYPKSQMLANVLGFCDNDGNGAYGLEQVWDDALQPGEVQITYERDRKGRTLHNGLLTDFPDADGRSLYLTIDEPIQDIVERELRRLAEEHKPKRAYAIMADPKTGAIMAMAQWPSYDPNDRADMDPKLWRNHMISDIYDPGSTMKCIAVAGALDFGTVTLNSKYFCEKGRWYYAGRSLRDAGHKYEDLTVAEIIQKSSNIGTAKIAIDMGRNRLYQTLRRFGFGERTELGLPHESRGILRTPRTWDGLSITRFPIGQGVSVTPLQMVQAYSALANDGRMMKLHLVDRVWDPQAQQMSVVEPELRQISARPQAIRDIVAAMKLVTEEGGTATKAAIKGYHVAGKTGTSQKLVNGRYDGHRKYFASFIGFVPAEDPRLVLLVVADEPNGSSYYGGTVCGPTFSRVGEQTLRYLNVPPSEPVDAEEAERRLSSFTTDYAVQPE